MKKETISSYISFLEKNIERLKEEKKDVKWFIVNYFTADNAFPIFNEEKDLWVAVVAKECYNSALQSEINYYQRALELTKKL